MIDLIDSAIAGRITTCLSWLERWGGLVIPVQRKVQHGNAWTTRTFPVSCSVDPQCEDDSKFQKILPNSAYKSVGYLQQIGDARTLFNGPRENMLVATYRLRLVVWLNYLKLGIDDCRQAGAFEVETIGNLKRDFSISSDQLEQAGLLRLSRFSILPKDPAQVFNPYHMPDSAHIYFWPYGFFAIEFDAVASINLSCLSALETGLETECLTSW